MIETIVIVLPKVLVGVDVVFINEVAHVGVGEDVFKLRVVVIGNLSEWVKEVGVDRASFDHVVPLFFLGCVGSLLSPGRNDERVEDVTRWVEREVCSVAHAAERTD